MHYRQNKFINPSNNSPRGLIRRESLRLIRGFKVYYSRYRTEANKYKDNDSSMKWIDRRCPRYISAENGVCKDVLGNRRIMKTKNLQKVAEEKLSKSIEQLELLMTLVESNTIEEILYFANVSGVSLSKKFVVVLKELKQHPEEMKECLKQGRWMYCNIYFPTCEARNGFIRQIPICKDICVKIEADICAKSIQLLELVNYEGNFNKPNCSLYPDRSLNHKETCISFNKTESKGMNGSNFFIFHGYLCYSLIYSLSMSWSSLQGVSGPSKTPESAVFLDFAFIIGMAERRLMSERRNTRFFL